MSYYFREKPRFGDKLRGKSGDELLEELKQQFADEGRQWDTQPPPSSAGASSRLGRDAFNRHTSFPRVSNITRKLYLTKREKKKKVYSLKECRLQKTIIFSYICMCVSLISSSAEICKLSRLRNVGNRQLLRAGLSQRRRRMLLS